MLKREIPDYRKKVYQLLDVKGEKFAYAVLKNKQKIDSAWDSYLDISKKYNPSEEYLAFDKDRVELAESMAKKDDKGEPIIKDERYDIENPEEFEKALNELKEKHAEAIKGREDQIAACEKELDEEYDIEFHKVSEVPDTISARELEAAEFMIAGQDKNENKN